MNYKMTEEHLRGEIIDFLYREQGKISLEQSCEFSTALLCLIAALPGNDYSFSDDMINDLPQFIPTEEEIKKYK